MSESIELRSPYAGFCAVNDTKERAGGYLPGSTPLPSSQGREGGTGGYPALFSARSSFLSIMSVGVPRFFAEDRHPVQYPAENENVDGCNREDNCKFPPARNNLVKMVGEIPVEGY